LSSCLSSATRRCIALHLSTCRPDP
jgi:hypothetical protein